MKTQWFVDFTSDFVIDEYCDNEISSREFQKLKEIIEGMVQDEDLAQRVFSETCSKIAHKVA